MKLYEFTYLDAESLPELEIVNSLTDFLESEAVLQGWKKGYNLRHKKVIRDLGNGQRELDFTVFGEYSDETKN